MPNKTLVNAALSGFPAKVAVPVSELFAKGHLDLETIESSCAFARRCNRLDLLVALTHVARSLRESGIDCRALTAAVDEHALSINPLWSFKRWRAFSRDVERIARLAAATRAPRALRTAGFADAFVGRWPGYLVRSSRRLAAVAWRQENCVADEHRQWVDDAERGEIAIGQLFFGGTRYTFHLRRMADGGIEVGSILGKRNASPPPPARAALDVALGRRCAAQRPGAVSAARARALGREAGTRTSIQATVDAFLRALPVVDRAVERALPSDARALVDLIADRRFDVLFVKLDGELRSMHASLSGADPTVPGVRGTNLRVIDLELDEGRTLRPDSLLELVVDGVRYTRATQPASPVRTAPAPPPRDIATLARDLPRTAGELVELVEHEIFEIAFDTLDGRLRQMRARLAEPYVVRSRRGNAGGNLLVIDLDLDAPRQIRPGSINELQVAGARYRPLAA